MISAQPLGANRTVLAAARTLCPVRATATYSPPVLKRRGGLRPVDAYGTGPQIGLTSSQPGLPLRLSSFSPNDVIT